MRLASGVIAGWYAWRCFRLQRVWPGLCLLLTLSVASLATPPQISNITPSHTQTCNTPANVTFSADVTDLHGVGYVQFVYYKVHPHEPYTGELHVLTDYIAPYSITEVLSMESPCDGPTERYEYYVHAVDLFGEWAYSPTTEFYLYNAPPATAIVNPLQNAIVKWPLSISASAADSNGSITNVKFGVWGNTWHQIDAAHDPVTGLYTATTSQVPVGEYDMISIAEDNERLTTYSDQIHVTIIPDIDIDIDSDNTKRYDAPDRNAAEDTMEMVPPGKVIIVNGDDDNDDNTPDCNDNVINGPDDAQYDMARVVIEAMPTWDTDNASLQVLADTYAHVRVFKGDGTCVLGPAPNNSAYTFTPSEMTEGKVTLLVEGVSNGETTLTLRLVRTPDGTVLDADAILITVTNTLAAQGLNFPLLYQHKDTNMLCCSEDEEECPVNDGAGHDWKSDHGNYLDTCEHCNTYCANASVAMINHYYKGDISQDYVSYLIRDRFTHGGDLGHGEGLTALNIPFALSRALKKDEDSYTESIYTDMSWTYIVDCIISYRPVLFGMQTIPGFVHAGVIVGFTNDNGVNRIIYYDPVDGYCTDDYDNIDFIALITPKLSTVDDINAVNNASDLYLDLDEDGITDFDEINRFSGILGTDCEHTADTNHDGIFDLQELNAYFH